jgi:hypothetical protein
MVTFKGGILLHLRGNILGFVHACSIFKYLRCITGRHNLPFYYEEKIAVQKSFLDGRRQRRLDYSKQTTRR